MQAHTYQNLAMRTNDGECTKRLDEWEAQQPAEVDAGAVLNACLGISGEAGELNDIIKKWIFHKKELNMDHVKKEVGDVCWYIALFCEAMGIKLDEVMQININKLVARYPEGFDVLRANNRSIDDI